MNTLDHGRRLSVLLLVVVTLLLVPSVATARFTATRSPTLAVGTDRMETPAAVTGTYRCALPVFTEGIDVTVTSFADGGPAGAVYDYRLTGPQVDKTASSAGHTVSMTSGGILNDRKATHWTLTIQSRLGSWTGTPYTRTITCPARWSSSGQL